MGLHKNRDCVCESVQEEEERAGENGVRDTSRFPTRFSLDEDKAGEKGLLCFPVSSV